ncbi:MAG: hypothetical protein LBE12_07085 [Planctomycetaceae bacterium]|nr:hypothetical protein [Planctomycetaceae bacterium]
MKKNQQIDPVPVQTANPIQPAVPVQTTTDSTTDLSYKFCPVLRQGKFIGAIGLLSRLANTLGLTAAYGGTW